MVRSYLIMLRGLTAARRALILTGFCAAAALTAGTISAPLTTASAAPEARTAPHSTAHDRTVPDGTAASLHVSGNHLVNASGTPVVLHGVNRSGGEFACVLGRGFWDGPMDQASITAMKRWHINAVRVPLNEACWNGQSYVKRKYRGTAYHKAVEAYVHLLNRNDLIAILDLHWSDGSYPSPPGCRSARSVCLKPMPDAAQARPFWRSVARTFKGNDSVIFDLFNEPYPERAPGATETEAWNCWLHGGHCTGIPYLVAGMQTLVNVVRSTGAGNVIMLGGLAWASDLSEWLQFEPTDPDHNLAASWHAYNLNGCHVKTCWNRQVEPVIKAVPVIAGEIGEYDCADGYISRLMRWLDARATSYLAWAWNADFGCRSGPSLITSYAGTPTRYGRGYRAHLLSLKS
jgi:endoglucanase